MDKITTLSAVEDASSANLVRLYNKLTGKNIKGFHDRKKAIAQTWAAIQNGKSAVKPTTKKGDEEMADSKRETNLSRIIRLQVEENPKRKGTKAWDKFAILMKCDGKPMSAYRDQEGKHEQLDEEKGWPLGELRWCLKKNFIKLENATATLAKAG